MGNIIVVRIYVEGELMTETIKATTTTEIKKCKSNCKNEFQDQTYGPGMRVMNSTRAKIGGNFRCTVCRTVQ